MIEWCWRKVMDSADAATSWRRPPGWPGPSPGMSVMKVSVTSISEFLGKARVRGM